MVELGKIANTQLGKMLSPKAKVGARPKPYLRNRDVQWGTFVLDRLPRMDFTADETEKFSLKTGDVVVCEGGEVGRAAIWRTVNSEVCFQKALHRVRCGPQLLPEWLYYLLLYYSQRNVFDEFVTGSTINHLPQEDLRRLPVPLPQLDHQHRIVEIIEEQFSRFDAADKWLRRAKQRVDLLEHAAFAIAFRTDAPKKTLKEIARTSSGGTPPRSAPGNYGGAIPWVKSGELGDSIVRQTSEFITDSALRSSSAKIVRRGALLMAMYGATVGKLGVLEIDAATNQAVCAIEPNDPEISTYLLYCLRALRPQLLRAAKGGAQPNISQGIIRELLIPVPVVEERERIEGAVTAGVDASKRLRAALDDVLRKNARMRTTVLREAFAGHLSLSAV